MFGYVSASFKELGKEEYARYRSIYCGICRALQGRGGQRSRLVLSYDMTFLALLLMSLYEPQEQAGTGRCAPHPLRSHPWTDNPYIRYAADMNLALSYYNCLDDWNDDKSHPKKWMADYLEQFLPEIRAQYPRQCKAIADCIAALSALEGDNCPNPDTCANCFGQLMAELLVYEEDLWAEDLRQMGLALGRFIYLADAATDYRKDARRHKYNPYLAMGCGEDWPRWEKYLVLTMARCTEYYEKLPLVQDKPLLDNILYSGVWTTLGRKRKEAPADGQ